MFSKIAILSFVSVLAAATQTIPVTYPTPTPTTISQGNTDNDHVPLIFNAITDCNLGQANCCNSVGQANILPGVSTILALLDINLDPITGFILRAHLWSPWCRRTEERIPNSLSEYNKEIIVGDDVLDQI
ncbi:hypothetical protein M422DRAFT_268559 [Sphaerobolus stellatus SS14]|uniref:Hydrophobin n=1 Tax=Sphaerobolus stellatus (strain SS14) TaxID=990650 RepID=A0A0C9TJY2_SPHS4|nr:hypothetical protein M422DRAFT_268559 [Sphaerobolus stellatus SS14]